MQVRRRLTEFESTIAMLAGAGLFVLMLAFLLSSARGGAQASARVANVPVIDLMIGGGALLLVGSLIAWLFVTRPWATAHDDWATPLYTGHHGEHHAADSHPATHGEMLAAVAEVEAEAEALAHGEMPPAMPDSAPVIEGVLPPDAPLAMTPQVAPAENVPADAIVTDDLTIIEGIGPKIAAALAAAGISTYAKMARQTPADLEQIVRTAGVRMVGHALTWPEQAQLLAEGRLEEWKALAARLKAGN
ncbi:MAG: DUF4332 domain-containing protein [Anaerolineae bacterium]|nr:DUF4332 domain-containing protein [Anaerolineae bacterium]